MRTRRFGEPEKIISAFEKADDPVAVVARGDIHEFARRPVEIVCDQIDLREGIAMVNAGENQLAGMADLRWVLLNCNEFRFIP